MLLLNTIKDITSWRKDKGQIAFIPTMGNLHDGHLQLIREAQKTCNQIVVSIFVNPIQFGENEDFSTYPRTLDEDAKKLANLGVSAIFAPHINDMYPRPQTLFITPAPIEHELCGKTRPGHFKGVLTVVNKLFNMVKPDIAYFGKKDYQQLFIIKDMVAQLNMPIEIIGVETQRAEDGLALSSRNGYLSKEERTQAPQLQQALKYIKQAVKQGNKEYDHLVTTAIQQLNSQGWQVDYIEIRNANTLLTATMQDTKLVVLAAAYLGKTRLIDNIEINVAH